MALNDGALDRRKLENSRPPLPKVFLENGGFSIVFPTGKIL